MGQKAHPIGNRLGIIKGWDSNWFGGNDYSDKLVEDEKIRKYLAARISKGGISKVVIERTLKRITITIHTARPGIVIGKGGQEVDKIKEELKKLTKKDVQINIFEIKRPELDAQLVGEGVAKQLEARISFRRAMKTSIASTMRMGAEGIKIMCSGRLGGAEMARTEQYKDGRVPLHTFRADIDYALSEALTTYGKIGVKVWIMKGEVYGKRDLSPNIGQTTGVKGRGTEGAAPFAGGGERRGGGDRRTDNRGGGGERRGGGDNRGGGQNRGGGPGGQNRGGQGGQNRGGNAGGAGGFRGKK
jgi:small subunit ribosomal protein S3